MLDMGWTEILVIGVVALIVVGPKDLPRMLRTLGQYTGKIRGMAREFQRSMDDAAREADLKEFKDIKGALDDVRSIQKSTSQGISSALSDAEKAIDREVDLEADDKPAAEKPTADAPTPLTPTQPLPTPASPTAASGLGKPAAEPASTPVDQPAPTPPKTGTDA